MARDCITTVKCSDCDSTQHVSAMHLGPAPRTTAPPTSPQHGGEEEEVNNTSEISSSCTSVCGTGQVGRSCSKLCLARVYQKDHPGKAIKAYIVLDDQSNRSLAKPSFFDTFNIQSHILTNWEHVLVEWKPPAEGHQISSWSPSTGRLRFPCHHSLSAMTYLIIARKSPHQMLLTNSGFNAPW